jgi:hypothetical protein
MICPICHTRWEAVRDESDPYEVVWVGICKCGTVRSVRMGRLIEKHTAMVLHEAKKSHRCACAIDAPEQI